MPGRSKNEREVETNARLWILGLGATIVGVALLWVSQVDAWFVWSPPLQATLEQVGGLVLATGLLGAGWEIVGKRRFSAEVLEKAKLSADVTQAGIVRVTDQYLEEVEWADLFAGAKRLEMVVAYARTWRNNHADRLRQLVGQAGGQLRVFLPDPDDETTMHILAARFDTTPARLAETVREAIQEYSAFRRPDGRGVEVWVRSGDAVFSCYRFDSRMAVLTLYSHARKRRTSVPTLVVGRGQLFRFVSDELTAIQEQSRRVYPPPPEEGDGGGATASGN